MTPGAQLYQAGRTVRRLVLECLAEAGTRKPDEVAGHLISSLLKANNLTRTHKTEGLRQLVRDDAHHGGMNLRGLGNAETIKRPTLSDRLRDTHLQRYVHVFNDRIERAVIELLQMFPPDRGITWSILDDTQLEYFLETSRHGSHCPPYHRCHYRKRAHSDNKRSYWANEWVVFSIGWKHQGQLITMPLQVRPLLGLGNAPERQLAELGKLLHRLKIRTRWVLADRYYDSAKARKAATQHGLGLVVRIQWDGKHPRIMMDARTGQRITLDDIADTAVVQGTPKPWKHRKRGTVHMDRRITRRVAFPGETRTWDLTVGVEVEAYEANGVRRWRRAPTNRRIALLAPAGLGEEALRVYRRRWAIETLFHIWALDRSRPRSQTIHAHVIQFSCHVLANTLGVCTWFMIEFGQSSDDHGADATFVSVTQVLVEIACDPG